MENMDEVNKRRGLRFAQKTRLPKFRAVSLQQKANEKAEELTVPKKNQGNETVSPQRRQWKSFDMGSPKIIKYERSTSSKVQEFVEPAIQVGKEDDEEEDEVENKLLSSQRPSDLHFARLKEDLAHEGTHDSLLGMAEDMLNGLDDLEGDEVAYRKEQAVFWLMKSAERGGSEALKKLKEMTRNGMSEGVRSEVLSFLALSNDGRLGRRIGKRLFHSLSGNRGFVPVPLLDEVMRTGLLYEGRFEKEDLDTKKEERIGAEECIQAGCTHVEGSVPEMDKKMVKYSMKRQKLKGFQSIMTRVYITLQALIGLLVAVISNTTLQVTLLLTTYHLMVHQRSMALVQASFRLVSISMPVIFAVSNVAKSVSQVSRMKKWEKAFSKTLTRNEEAQIARKYEEHTLSELVNQMSFMSCLILLSPIVQLPETSKQWTGILILSYLATDLKRERFWKTQLLVACFVCAVTFNQEIILDQVKLLYLPLNKMDIPMVYLLPSLLLPLTCLQQGFTRGLKTFSFSCLAAFGISNAALLAQDLGGLIVLGLSLSLLAMLNNLLRLKTSLSTCLSVLFTLATALSLLTILQGPPTVSKVTWDEFRTECPLAASAQWQVKCLEFARLNLVSWQGKVERIEVEQREEEVNEQINRFLKNKIWEPVSQKIERLCKERSGTHWMTDNLCHYSNSVRYPFEHLNKGRHSCKLYIKMKGSFFKSEGTGLTIRTGAEMWEDGCENLELGDDINFVGNIVSVANVEIQAKSIKRLK